MRDGDHSPGSIQGITAVYNRYRYADEKRSALTAWANKVKEIVDGKPRENVVPLRG